MQHSLCRDSQACREAEPLAQRRDVLAVWQPLPGDPASAGSVLSACGAEQRSVPHGEDLLSDEEQYLQVVRKSLDAHWPEMKASLVAEERWEELQNLIAARSMISGRVIQEEDRPSVLQALRVLQDVISADDRPSVLQALQVWGGHAQSLQVVRTSMDAHWPEVKASLVAQERWEELQNLTCARSMISGRVIQEEDRPSVLQALRVLQDVISADDRPSVLQALQVLQGV